jgi:hypothetical protein
MTRFSWIFRSYGGDNTDPQMFWADFEKWYSLSIDPILTLKKSWVVINLKANFQYVYPQAIC